MTKAIPSEQARGDLWRRMIGNMFAADAETIERLRDAQGKRSTEVARVRDVLRPAFTR